MPDTMPGNEIGATLLPGTVDCAELELDEEAELSPDTG